MDNRDNSIKDNNDIILLLTQDKNITKTVGTITTIEI